MVDELAQHRQTRLAAQVDKQRTAKKQQQYTCLGDKGKAHATLLEIKIRQSMPVYATIINGYRLCKNIRCQYSVLRIVQ
ncbi:hypothetical protein D3C76_1680490 [compost metagenome]